MLAAQALLGAVALAATVPSGFVDSIFVGVPSDATAMKFAPDGRLFVCQQSGKLRVVQNGTLLATPFVSLTVNGSDERGLLGVAFDPDFETNNFVYVYYTAVSPTVHNRVSRFTANGNVAVPGSEVVLLDLNPLDRHLPQRRSAPLRQRRQALHRGWRQRQRQQLPVARQPLWQDAADQSRWQHPGR